MVEDLSSLRLNKLPNDLKSRDSRMLLYNNVKVSSLIQKISYYYITKSHNNY